MNEKSPKIQWKKKNFGKEIDWNCWSFHKDRERISHAHIRDWPRWYFAADMISCKILLDQQHGTFVRAYRFACWYCRSNMQDIPYLSITKLNKFSSRTIFGYEFPRPLWYYYDFFYLFSFLILSLVCSRASTSDTIKQSSVIRDGNRLWLYIATVITRMVEVLNALAHDKNEIK